jgi:hypothetical protein
MKHGVRDLGKRKKALEDGGESQDEDDFTSTKHCFSVHSGKKLKTLGV